MRSNITTTYGPDVISIGGAGFGIMAIIVGVARRWLPRADAVERLLLATNFLWHRTDSFHGAFPHLVDGASGRTIPFRASSRKDDGGDLVETSYLCMGLLCARQYFKHDTSGETELRRNIDRIWEQIDWRWYTRNGANVLYWHWSPNNGWGMNQEIRGWNECLVAYILAASAPVHDIDAQVYHHGWPQGYTFRNGRSYYDIHLQLGPHFGGPLTFAHYSFIGLDPRELRDRYADYWNQNLSHVLINREHCIRNPNGFKGYGPACWGLAATDDEAGRWGCDPESDEGVIRPTAALSSFPYAPKECMAVLRHFVHELDDKIMGKYGFCDAFCENDGWAADFCYSINQGPIICMIENYRSALLWDLFMSNSCIQKGLQKLGFRYREPVPCIHP